METEVIFKNPSYLPVPLPYTPRHNPTYILHKIFVLVLNISVTTKALGAMVYIQTTDKVTSI